MKEIQQIPTKELLKLDKAIFAKSETAKSEMDAASEEIENHTCKIAEYEELVRAVKKRIGYDKRSRIRLRDYLEDNGLWDQLTDEESDAVELLQAEKSELRDARHRYDVARAQWLAYLECSELVGYFTDYDTNSNA